MKKRLLTLFIILFLPINIFAYSSHVVLGGNTIGIEINTNGLVVVGFYKVNGKYIGKDTFKVGDAILSINDISVNSVNDLTNIISDNIDNVSVSIKRGNKIINTNMNVEIEDNLYKTGLYIKDNITGIGTLTYIDPNTKIYGALGHEIVNWRSCSK